jgi:hypothetical protein
MESLNIYSTQTERWGAVQNIEAITDTATVGGNSVIGGMREVRNAHRLGLTGVEQDNEVGVEQLVLPRVNGSIPSTTVADPVTGQPIVVPVVTTGPIVDIPIITGGPVDGPSAGNGNTSPWTTLVPDTVDIISITPIVIPSILTPAQAIEEVIFCNCDCWDDLI